MKVTHTYSRTIWFYPKSLSLMLSLIIPDSHDLHFSWVILKPFPGADPTFTPYSLEWCCSYNNILQKVHVNLYAVAWKKIPDDWYVTKKMYLDISEDNFLEINKMHVLQEINTNWPFLCQCIPVMFMCTLYHLFCKVNVLARETSCM